jgi:hypothetical protein
MTSRHPDSLSRPDPARVQQLLDTFWQTLGLVPDLLQRDEWLLCADECAGLRRIVVEMMLALNGIAWPAGTRHLNRYLGASQREALNKTLIAPVTDRDSWVGQAVALLVIYRWYAPQLLAEHPQLTYPSALEASTLSSLAAALPDWPETITTA